ncbi:MAG: hypothetical protein M0Q43_09415, partial [Methanothrix sp.]|nr:hypothetical protein [Methanothrix sp.]
LYALERGIISGVTDIKDLTIPQAKAIYKVLYWFPLRLQDVKDIAIAAEIFDTGVNSGTPKAALIAQLALDYLGETLALDGNLGPTTLGLINKWCQKDPRALMVSLNGIQFIHFCAIVDQNIIDTIQSRVRSTPDQQQFARGWTKRIQEYRKEV